MAKYEIDWAELERTIDRDVQPIERKATLDAWKTIDDSPVDVPAFVTIKPSKFDLAYMGISKFAKTMVPVVIGAGVAVVAGTNAGIAAGTVAAATMGIAKVKKEQRKAVGADPGMWDIIGRIIANIMELVRCIKK